MPEDLRTVLAREAALLVERVRPWYVSRWAGRAEAWAGPALDLGSRGDVAHHLAEVLAAPVLAGAGRQGAVPRLPHDTALPDQLAVLAADLLDAVDDPAVLRTVLVEVLLHRADLDGSPAGAGATALVTPGASPAEAVAGWRAACDLSRPGVSPRGGARG